MMANNPFARMDAFDSLPADERALSNEFGVNVVGLYRGMGARGDSLRAACERHRANKQFEHLRETENLGRDIARRMQSRGRSIR